VLLRQINSEPATHPSRRFRTLAFSLSGRSVGARRRSTGFVHKKPLVSGENEVVRRAWPSITKRTGDEQARSAASTI
jgi:hypothetical protein